MKKILKRSVIFLLLLSVILLPSCFNNIIDKVNQIEDLRWNPNLSVPLAYGSFTINDFIDDLEGEDYSITSSEDGLILFNYSVGEVFSTTASDLIDIEDESRSLALRPDLSDIPDLSIPVTGTFTLNETHEIDVSPPDGDKLYLLQVKEGTLEISATGSLPGSGEVLISFGCVTRNDAPLEVSFEWNYDGTNAQQFVRSIDLRGYEIDYTNNGTTENYLSFTTSLSVSLDNQRISLQDMLSVDLGFRSLEFSQVLATVQPRSVTADSYEMTIEFMDDIIDGDYYFDEPAITLNVENSFGVPLQIAILDLIARSESKGQLEMTGTIVDAPQAINYPSFEEIGQSARTTITVNHENSNLPSVISWQPETITYTFEGSVKEAGVDDVHFILDTSRIEATLKIEIPWIGRIEDLVFEDSIDFDGSQLDDVDEEIAQALFRLSTSNGLPVNATVQVYFVSEFGAVVDSLFYDDQHVLTAGQIDASGRVSQPRRKETDVIADKDRLARISDAGSIIIKAQLSTPENSTRSIRIYSDDRLDINLFVQTQFDIVF